MRIASKTTGLANATESWSENGGAALHITFVITESTIYIINNEKINVPAEELSQSQSYSFLLIHGAAVHREPTELESLCTYVPIHTRHTFLHYAGPTTTVSVGYIFHTIIGNKVSGRCRRTLVVRYGGGSTVSQSPCASPFCTFAIRKVSLRDRCRRKCRRLTGKTGKLSKRTPGQYVRPSSTIPPCGPWWLRYCRHNNLKTVSTAPPGLEQGTRSRALRALHIVGSGVAKQGFPRLVLHLLSCPMDKYSWPTLKL